jgi:outer membrane receptor protein involved in Fe transport
MKYLVFVFFTAILMQVSQLAFSQGPSRGNYQGAMPMDAKITGTVIDGSNGQQVEYAVIAVRKQKDSSLVTGTTSTSTGSYTVEGLPYGKFYCEITFVGYKKQKVENILLTPNHKIANLGTIKIDPASTNISEVVVTGNKSPIEYKIDKKIVDVSSNIAATGGTLVDALQNTPSVQTDVEGNVTLRGNSNFTVLIDGKPSPLNGTEALQQIPANLVQNVEIITNPSAKYDAEGTAGIINVVMKKQKVSGMNGIFNVTGGTGNNFGTLDKNGANFNMNYKYSKFNFTLGADFTDMKYGITSYSHTQNDTLNKLVLDRTANSTFDFHRQGKGIKFGVDYDITKNSTISLMGSIGSRNMYRPNTSNTFDIHYDTLGNKKNVANYIASSTNEAIRAYYNLNLNYQLKLDDKGQQLSASTYFNAGPDNVPSNVIIDTTNSNWASLHKQQPQLQVAQNSYETEFRGNLDYTLPIGEQGKLEIGYQGRFYQNNGNDSTIGSIYTPIQQLKAKDQIEAGYVSFSNSSFIDYQLGFRTEYEMRDIKFGNNDKKMNNPFYDPTVHLSKQLPWDLQLLASYTRRINRPREWNLNPVPRYQSLTSIMVGDPGLKPEIANSYELSLQKKLNEASFISAESFFRQTDHLMYQKMGFENNNNILTFENLGNDRSIGVEFMLNLALARFFNFNASSSIYNYHIFGQPITNPNAKSSTNTWNIKVNPTIRMPWGMGIQINYTYNGPTINATEGKQLGYYSSSVGIRQEILKHKGSLTLMAQNPIGYTRVISTTYGDNTTSYGWFQRESKVYLLTFSYRFNNYKVQPNKHPQEDNNNNDMDINGIGY